MTGEAKKDERRFLLAGVLTIAAAHFLHDIFTALISPLLPLLIEKLELSLLLAGSLSVIPQLPPLLNPIVGSAVDRGGFVKALVVVAPFVTATTFCLVGLAPTYPLVAGLLLAGGFSVAAIHLAAPVIISDLSGGRVGRGMSLFMVGGEAARMAGPPFAVLAVTTLTLEGLWKLIPVGLGASLYLWWRLAPIELSPRAEKNTKVVDVWIRMRRVIIPVLGIMLARSFMAAAATTFLPTFRYREGETLLWANAALFLVELGGVLGVFASGTLSDRFGRRRVLLVAVVLSPPLMLAFLASSGPLTWVALLVLGFFTISTTPVLWALMLENAGTSRATSSGTYTMISFALRALVTLLVGHLGDVYGLRATYYFCAAMACVGIPFVLMLPRAGGQKSLNP